MQCNFGTSRWRERNSPGWKPHRPRLAAEGDGISSVRFSDNVYGDDFGKGVAAVTVIDANGSANTGDRIFFSAPRIV